MKKLFIVFSSVLFLTTSCKKELVKTPYNAVSDQNAFETASDFENAMRGVYQNIAFSQGYYGGDMIILPDLLADNLIINNKGRLTFQTIGRWQYNGNNTVGLFGAGYSIIRRANGVLQNIDNGIVTGTEKDNLQGEALAVRGLVHFDIARLYAKVPSNNINPNQDLGIPYVTDIDVNSKPAREPIADVYTKIVADLTQALTLVADDPSYVSAGRLNKAAVAGILAKVYLYLGQWQNAVTAATTSLDLNNNVGSRDELADIFTDATDDGVLFKTVILDKDNIQIGVNYSQSANGSIKSEYVSTYDLYQLYSDNDIRKSVYITVSPYSGVDQLHIAKYFGRATGNLNTVDAKILRVADVLLIRAECYAQLSDLTNALIDLNALKEQRYSPYTPFAAADKATLLNEIWKERRLELAFEGDRFFDLKRRNLGVQRNQNYGDAADGSGVKFPDYALSLTPDDYRLQLPFPQSELNVNPNFKQNPNY